MVFIWQRILRFSCLVLALDSYLGHYHQFSVSVHTSWAVSDRLFPEPPNSQDPLEASGQHTVGWHISCHCTAGEWQLLLACWSIYGTTTNPLGSNAGNAYTGAALTQHKTSAEGWKLILQAN